MKLPLPGGSTKRAIGLAPLIDIVFILLIFFVLESTLIVFNEVNIDFPSNVSVDKQSATGSGLSVEVFGVDKLWVSGRKMNMEQLRSYIQEAGFSDKIPVHLALSEDSPVQAAVFVLDILNEYGMNNISLGAVKP